MEQGPCPITNSDELQQNHATLSFHWTEMLQRVKWKKGVIQRKGCDLIITVSPRSGGNGSVTILTSLLMVFGFLWLDAPTLSGSFADVLLKALPTLFFCVLLFFWTKGFVEQETAEEIVTVRGGGITWVRRTKWWTRKRQRNASAITDIFADNSWTGLGKVVITMKWQRYIILDNLLGQDAIRFARELKRAAQIESGAG
jgi:hypothetical protein